MRRVLDTFFCLASTKDPAICVLVGDIGYGVFDKFREKWPERFLNLGICEQSIVGIAAGMALQGLKPYVYTITPFITERAYEQIKLDVAANNANVKLIGYADYADQGVTHIPVGVDILERFIKVLEPQSLEETMEMLWSTYQEESPVVISLTRDRTR